MNMLADFEKLEKPEEFFSDEKKIKKELHEKLFSAVEILVSGKKDIPVAFSGGLDFSIMAYIGSADFLIIPLLRGARGVLN